MGELHSMDDQFCSIARAVGLLADKWTLLIVREAFWGKTRFSEFRQELRVAPNILSNRLAHLVEEGILERQEYQEEHSRTRSEYHLTPKGRDLQSVIASLAIWGRDNDPIAGNRTPTYTDATTGESAELGFVTEKGRRVAEQNVVVHPAPYL
jgi:DNA-binding HxlR family transcriptional regulator